MRKIAAIFLFALGSVFVACAPTPKNFDGTNAHQTFLMAQMNLGSRPAGSPAGRATGDYIITQLKQMQWRTETQEFTFRNVAVRNITGKAAESRGPVIILGAHYDTRPRADQDKTSRDQPVPGANDGASGVAVLLELARTLDVAKLKNEVWFAFFDAEDNGALDGCVVASPPCERTPWGWSVGAEHYAANLKLVPDAVVIVDMIGDADQNLYYEHNSDAKLQQQLWTIAARLGYTRQFIPEYKWSMEDDHTPFLKRQIRAIDIIDFDYPYWHTTQDTADKVSAESLGRIGTVLQVWLEGR